MVRFPVSPSMKEFSAVSELHCLFIVVVLVCIGICTLGPGVDAEPDSNAPVMSPSSSSPRSSVCSMRGSLSPKPSTIMSSFVSESQKPSFVSESFKRSFDKKKIPNALKADRIKHRVTFNPNKASLGETLRVAVLKLEDGVVLVPGSLSLLFNLVVSSHANNFLVNVSRALVSSLRVTFAGEELQYTNAFDLYKLFEDLFLAKAQRKNMYLEGIQSEDLCKVRSNSEDKKTSGVVAESKLNTVYGNKYRIPLDHEILKDHGVFFPRALPNQVIFEIKPAQAKMVVKGSDASQLGYELTNIELEYEVIHDTNLAREASSSYLNGKEFMYEHVTHYKTLTVKKLDHDHEREHYRPPPLHEGNSLSLLRTLR